MNRKKIINGLLTTGVVLVLLFCFHWSVNRVYVPEGQSLLLRYKGPLLFGTRAQAEPGHFANEDKGEIGIYPTLRGPGRHFYCPVWWDRTLVPDQVVLPGQVAIVRSMLGNELPDGQYLVDGNLDTTKYKGILRKAYGPGRYRANPYAYEFQIVNTVVDMVDGQAKHSGWVHVPTGCVGVVTNLADIPQKNQLAGIQSNVLPPGIYPINSKEQQIDVVEIGYRESTIPIKTADGTTQFDGSGQPIVTDGDSGIRFPSNDGFAIQIDETTIWGILPAQAPDIIRTFGNLAAVEDKVVRPQMESISRNKGSQYSAVELLVGEKRQKFQEETAAAFGQVLSDKNLSLLYCLVRHIYIPTQVREPIQNGFIADELKLTRDQEQKTAKTEGDLREAERSVALEAQKVTSDTDKQVATLIAEGNKTVAETSAETVQLAAAIDKKVAGLEAQSTVVRGEASAKSDQLQAEARAQKFALAVQAFGSGDAYNQWVFASSLPDNVELNLLYAGPGTFWTDLDGFTNKLLGKQLSNQQQVTDK